jgi:protein TonB
MPQELLRDVLRTGDASGRARRRMSILPLSIAVHAVVIVAILISPLAAGIDLPGISSPLRVVTLTAALPPEPPPPGPRVTPDTPKPAAPIVAPSTISPDPPPVPPSGPPGPPGGIGPQTGFSGIGGFDSTALPVPGPPPPPPPAPPKIVRAGIGVREPKKLVHLAPEYPPLAQQARVEGTVVLEAILDEQGRVQSVRVAKSQPLLDAAAIRAVSAWRYSPTTLNGVPVSVLMTITITFKLDR